ncbi:DNA-binding protein [Klebsiella pneumoniae subsp. pneumoniae]|nr:DNA-binding protein [Klebsiella pneumoniae subsp. pneumoniae]
MTAKNKYKSPAFEAIHSAASGLFSVGAIPQETMRHFDESCLGSVAALQPIEIKALREQLNVSQPVFARYLNTSVSTVQKWETGAKRPSGMSLKLLSVVQKHGLKSYCSYPAGWRLRLSGLQVTSEETVGRIRRSRHPAHKSDEPQAG